MELEPFSYLPMLLATLPDGRGGAAPCPTVMTEAELIAFLRIPQISGAKDPHNVVEWLKRARGLPFIPLSHKCVYSLPSILKWLSGEVEARRGTESFQQSPSQGILRSDRSCQSHRKEV